MVSLHKFDNNSNVCNYKPFSKMSEISKVFEALITTTFSGLMNNCSSNRQHGFHSKRSIIINNVTFQSDILDCIGKGK